MNAYTDDPRVTAKSLSGTAFTVDRTDRGYSKPAQVWLRGDGQWVASPEHGVYRDYPTADEAIHSLIGDPQ